MELEKVDVELAPVLIRLRQLVDWHAMIPDRPLPTERELARQLNISRGALRRGLAQLESEGLIWRRQGKGTFVGPASVSFAPNIKRLSSRTNFFEVMEVRLHIEPALVHLAALRASGSQIAMIERLAAHTLAVNERTDARSVELGDGAFHRAIAEAAGNRLFLDLSELVEAIRQDEVWETYRAKARTPDRIRISGQQHVEIAQAIGHRDPGKAAAIMRKHLGSLQQALMAAIEEDSAITI